MNRFGDVGSGQRDKDALRAHHHTSATGLERPRVLVCLIFKPDADKARAAAKPGAWYGAMFKIVAVNVWLESVRQLLPEIYDRGCKRVIEVKEVGPAPG